MCKFKESIVFVCMVFEYCVISPWGLTGTPGGPSLRFFSIWVLNLPPPLTSSTAFCWDVTLVFFGRYQYHFIHCWEFTTFNRWTMAVILFCRAFSLSRLFVDFLPKTLSILLYFFGLFLSDGDRMTLPLTTSHLNKTLWTTSKEVEDSRLILRRNVNWDHREFRSNLTTDLQTRTTTLANLKLTNTKMTTTYSDGNPCPGLS
jgi:hypothetical protein